MPEPNSAVINILFVWFLVWVARKPKNILHLQAILVCSMSTMNPD